VGVFDDDEDEHTPQGAAAIASALAGTDEAAPPEEIPVAPAPRVQPSDDTTAQDMASNDFVPDPRMVQQDAAADSAIAQNPNQAPQGDDQPLVAPPAPVFKPYSTEPADAAHELAQEKSDFAEKVASGAYKPSVLRNIGAGLAAAAAGWKGGAEAGGKVGQEIRSAPLDRATANEQLAEQGTQSRIDAGNLQNQSIQRENQNAAAAANWADRDFANQARVRDWNAQAQQRQAMAQQRLKQVDPRTIRPVDPKDPFGEYMGTSPDGTVVRGLEPPASIQKDPRYITAQNLAKVQSMKAAGIKMTPEQEAIVASGGKITPSVHTNINVRENPDGSAVQPREPRNPANNPNADLAASAIVSDAMQKKQNFTDSYVRQPDGSYKLDDSLKDTVNLPEVLSPQEFHDKIEEIGRTTPNKALARFGRQIDQDGNLVGGQPGSAPGAASTVAATPKAAVPAQQPAATGQPVKAPVSGKTVKIGDPIRVGNRTGTVAGINPQTGKIIPKWD
jgi:hypothetical protein